LHTFGVGESWIAQELEGLGETRPEVRIGFRAKPGEVDIRISARADTAALAHERVIAAADDVRDRLGGWVYGHDGQTMAQLAGRSLRSRGLSLSVAESCTGGLIACQLTSEPASDFFLGGVVAYANAVKKAVLGVSEDTLRGHGAVSAEVAAEMAEGARRAFDCDVALSVTGIAGPTGASPNKPVGLVHWAVAYADGTVCEERIFHGDRNQVQKQAATAALDLVRRTIANANGSRVGEPAPVLAPPSVSLAEPSG
ncbi:MAG: nicotinamide-nucleotide amidohydrolase family protein, partial [Myxococcota bacterium]